MMYCLILEEKMDGVTSFRGMKLYIIYFMREFVEDIHLEKGPFPFGSIVTTRKKDLFPSSDNRPKGILDLVHIKEAQELEAVVVMSPTINGNLK